MKLQDSSEEVTMELRDSQKLPIDTTTGWKPTAVLLHNSHDALFVKAHTATLISQQSVILHHPIVTQ